MKRYFALLICFLLIIGIWYYFPTSIAKTISDNIDISTVEQINIILFNPGYSHKFKEVSDLSTINELTKNLNEIKVSRRLRSTSTYTFRTKEYNPFIILLTTNTQTVSISIFDGSYVSINNNTYKICKDQITKDFYNLVYQITAE
jgi:hypothetical protein